VPKLNPWTAAKEGVCRAFARLIASQRGRDDLLRVTGTLTKASPTSLGIDDLAYQPYPELPCGPSEFTGLRDDVVIITARFRSGSTLLWNLFRHVKGVTAYYEPFNERRWFNAAVRGTRVDRTHRQVDDYWAEYEGLQELGAWYDEDWNRRDLYMDAGFWAPRMKRYIEILIDRAQGRPVLQFNRIDFRLPWFRRQFPHARIVHLYRHPRDQWLSTLGEDRDCGTTCTVEQFAHYDGYYLLGWANDLATHFPMLRPEPGRHPYELFYLIWRLSFLFGRRFAHYSVSFERLLAEPVAQLAELMEQVGIEDVHFGDLRKLLSPPAVGKWRTYADETWFLTIEQRCESLLLQHFGSCAGMRAANQELVPA
jgi:hypothetical protein